MIVVNCRILAAPTSGVQRYLLELLPHLHAYMDAPMDGVKEMRPAQAMMGIRGHLWEQLILPRQLGQALLWSPASTGPLWVTNQVVTIHDMAPLDHPEWFARRFSWWYSNVVPRLAKTCRKIITVSEFSKSRILFHCDVPEDKVVVIANGVSARFTGIEPQQIHAARQHLHLPHQYVLSVGSIEPRKNLPRLLAAWQRILPHIPRDVGLVIAGLKGKERVFSNSGALGALPERVHLTGFVADDFLPGLYAGALAFVYPSYYEGFGLPPLEAMTAGTPVIAGSGSALEEVVGEAGVMVSPFDKGGMAEAMKNLILDPQLRSQLIQKGQERARLFTWQKAAQQTAILLSSLANNSRS